MSVQVPLNGLRLGLKSTHTMCGEHLLHILISFLIKIAFRGF